MESKNSSKDVVLSFLKTLNSGDFKTAGNYIAEDVSFFAPDGAPVSGAKAYFDGLKPLGLSYVLKKVFADGSDVCIIYDISFSKPAAVTLFACGLYSVVNGKISSIRVIFDPRPLFNNPKK